MCWRTYRLAAFSVVTGLLVAVALAAAFFIQPREERVTRFVADVLEGLRDGHVPPILAGIEDRDETLDVMLRIGRTMPDEPYEVSFVEGAFGWYIVRVTFTAGTTFSITIEDRNNPLFGIVASDFCVTAVDK